MWDLCDYTVELSCFFFGIRFPKSHLAGDHGGDSEWSPHVSHQHPYYNHLPQHQTSHSYS